MAFSLIVCRRICFSDQVPAAGAPAALFDAFTTVVKAIIMRQYRMKRQRESEIAMGEALEGDFRKAMRTLASAVSIVSTAHDGRRFGMTATAVCSLSMQPPTLLVCVNQSTSLHHPVLSAGRFCINILHADQDELARTFGRKGIEDRFASGNWQVDDRGVPFVADAQASIFCAVEETYGHRTHSIVVGAVYRAAVREAVHPLLYQDGRYTVGLADGVDWVIPIGH
jgi:flavin reductase (DIM6/NTAB) family NADH-FMN oxidoreductase RutF